MLLLLKRQALVVCSVCKMQTTINNWAESCYTYLFSRFVMLYREYTEDWRFRDRAPLSTPRISRQKPS